MRHQTLFHSPLIVCQAFAKEIYFHGKLNCANIVEVFGILIENDTPSIVMEWASDGSLDEYLRNCDGRYDDLGIVSIVG